MRHHFVGITLLCLSFGALSEDAPRTTSTNVSLREYIDLRFAEQEKAVSAALAAADRAETKAENTYEKRFESQNEFRGQLGDQAKLFLPRTEYNNAQSSLVEKIDKIDKRLTFLEDRGSTYKEGWGYVLGVAGLIFGVGALLVPLYLKRRSV